MPLKNWEGRGCMVTGPERQDIVNVWFEALTGKGGRGGV